MKLAVSALALLALAPAPPATAHACDRAGDLEIHSLHCSAPAYLAPRHDADDVRLGIETESGGATLLVTDRVVAVQLSDRMMKRVRRELRDDAEAGDNALAVAIKDVVMSAVRRMLDHSLECRVEDLRDVRYRDGRLEFVTNDGGRLFDTVDVEGRTVVADGAERDALAFVREFHRVKQRRD